MDKRVIAHIDMDCFFAAVEEKYNPRYKNKPLIVGGDKNSTRGVVCTANYEARKFGVHSAMPISQAIRLCPNGTFIQTNHSLYKSESEKIMNIIGKLFPIYSQVSIDEAYIDITHLVQSQADWKIIATRIKSIIAHKAGYSCSVGIGESTVIAKIGSAHQKPGGITVITDPKTFLHKLSISIIPGIGKKSISRYHSKHIHTVGDLARKNIFELISHFGQHIVKQYKIANGNYFNQITMSDSEKSISSESTFSEDVYDKDEILKNLQKLALKVYGRIQEYEFKTVSIKMRFSDFHTITRSFTFSQHGNSLASIIIAIQEIYAQNMYFEKPIRLLGVKLEHLTQTPGRQYTLKSFS